ncbi:hypothetical protein F5B17DRAFT_391007 [Nemania serpens]|nr:hypothetical protein F5B17DRAFT_391007 [Nemania serpens]
MPSFVITGTSRGLGFEFLRQLSSDPKNTVIGLVRNKPATDKKVAEEIPNPAGKIHILHGDLDDYESLKKAAEDTAAITGGSLDYLIASAARMPVYPEFFKGVGQLASDPAVIETEIKDMMRTNVTGNIHLIKLFLPLILKGQTKKIITITSGMADLAVINGAEVVHSPIYSMTKAAMNVITAKLNAEYKKDGVLFIGICPGTLDGEGADISNLSENEKSEVMTFMGNLNKMFPNFKGPRPPSEIVPKIKKVWEEASLEKGDGGAFLSHTGVPGQWL